MSLLRPPIIVSIATIPSRIGLMRPTLESLLNAQLVPDQILVVRPEFCTLENSSYVIPDFLLDSAFCRGVVKMVMCPHDWGPGNKLLGALDQLLDECFLVLADVDVLYGPRFLSDLVLAQEQQRDCCFSYYTYRVAGLTLGQGCDGFSFWSPNLAGIEAFFERFRDKYIFNLSRRSLDFIFFGNPWSAYQEPATTARQQISLRTAASQ